jgi:hypothetical protein
MASAVTGSLVIVALAMMAAAAPAARSTLLNNSTTYTPPPEYQDQSGPVISSVVVSSDDKTITFQVNTPNRPSFTPDMVYRIYVDADNTPSNGDQDAGGADVDLRVSDFGGSMELRRFFWDGTGWPSVPGGGGSDGTFTYSGGLTLTVPRWVVEGRDSRSNPIPTIRFGVNVWSGVGYESTTGTFDYSNGHRNDAPFDLTDLYSYDFEPGVTAPPYVPPSFSASRVTVSKARAGKLFTASMVVTNTQSGRPLLNVNLACYARVAGRILPVLRRWVSKAGRATCSWNLPKSSRGKQINGTITTSVPAFSASRSFATRIL